MPTRRHLLRAAPALVGLGAAGAARAQAADPRPVLRVGVQALPPTLEPIEAISNVGLRVTDNVFDTLLRRDFAAEARGEAAPLLPRLATGLRQRDPLSWEVELRDGVRLHDGTTLTAADVAASLSAERVWGPQAPFYEGRVAFGHLAAVEAEGTDRVILRTREPDVVMPQRLAAYAGWIGSAKYLAEAGLAGMRTKPVGSGPYRVASFQRDQRAVLDSFDEHWAGAPPAKQVVFTVVPEASSRLAGLQAGDFDLVTNLLPEQAETLARDPRVEGVAAPLDLGHLLVYDTRRPALADPRVRRALNHAIDYETLGRGLWGEGFRPMPALQTPAFGNTFDVGRRGFHYDPDLSRRLLREANWRPQEVIVRLAPGYYLNMLQAVQVIQTMWEAVGVPSRVETRENLSLVNQPGADVRPTSVSYRFPDPLGSPLMLHLSRGYFIQNDGYWTPTRFNEIAEALRRATEPAERRRLFLALMDEFEAEAPAALLYAPMEFFGKRRSIRFQHYPLYYLDFRSSNLAFT